MGRAAQLIRAGRPATAFHPSFAVLDGTNDYALRGAALTGAANGKVGTLSVWCFASSDGALFDILSGTPFRLRFNRNTASRYQISCRNAANTQILLASTSTPALAGSLHHVLMSWNMAGAVQVYLDDAADMILTTQTNDTIDYAGPTDWAIGATTAGAGKTAGHLAELYFNSAVAIDFSDVANRRKFRDHYGRPVDLGTDGSTPTGTAPIMYHSLRSTTAADFATNRGTGGNFTVTGALDLGFQAGLSP